MIQQLLELRGRCGGDPSRERLAVRAPGQICREECEFGSWLLRGALLCIAVPSYLCHQGKDERKEVQE